MPNYRLAEDFGYWKAGTISEYDGIMNSYRFKYCVGNCSRIMTFEKEEIQLLLKQGHIEEVPEPKWRDEDMIEFAKIMVKNHNKFVNIYEFNFKSELLHYEQSRQTKNI